MRYIVAVLSAWLAAIVGTASYAEEPDHFSLDEVVVTAEEGTPVQNIGRTSISAETISRGPKALFSDLATTLGTFPGVIKGSRFSSLLYIRGSRPYETLFVLNDVPLVYPYKWGGGLLMYNEELVDRADLYAGGFSAEFPEAMGGVVDVDYDRGNADAWSGSATLSAETSVKVNAPIFGGACVFSYRRSFYDLVLRQATQGDKTEFLFFEDWYASASYWIHPRVELYAWLLYADEGTRIIFSELAEAEDEFTEDDQLEYSSQKLIAAVDLRCHFSDSSRARLIYAFNKERDDDFGIRTFLFEGAADGETDYSILLAKYEHELPWNRIELGYGLIYFTVSEYEFVATAYIPDTDNGVFVEKVFRRDIDDLSADGLDDGVVQYGYLQDTMDVGRLSVRPGVNIAFTDMVRRNRTTVDPRLQATYELTPRIELKAACGQYSRHNTEQLGAGDSPDLEPERSYHYVLGAETVLGSDYRVRLEVYHKDMRDLIVEDAENRNLAADGEYEFIYDNRGKGYAEGVELFLQKKRNVQSRFDGWVGYTYAVTRRNDRSEDRPDWYHPTHDQRHTLNVVANYFFLRGKRHELFLTTSLEYHSGRPYEDFDILPIVLKSRTVYVADYNGRYRRMPDYFNLDLKLEWVVNFRAASLHAFVELLNATDHGNVTEYYVPSFRNERREQTEPGILPMLGFKAAF